MPKLILTALLALVAVANVMAQHDTIKAGERLRPPSNEPQQRIVRPTRMYLDFFGVFGRNASEFFDDYRKYLGGISSTFDAPLGIGGGISSFQIPDLGIGIKAAYSRSVVRETYLYAPLFDTTRPKQSTTQDFTLSVIPVMLTLDYFQLNRQFTTYVGVSAGLAFTDIQWTESLATTTLPGARLSGERYDDSHVSPAVGVRAGVSLGWDSRTDAAVQPALYVEASYTYIPVSAPLFQEVAKTLSDPPERLRQAYAMQAGGFGVHIGISLLVH